jgi:hypothetical protein
MTAILTAWDLLHTSLGLSTEQLTDPIPLVRVTLDGHSWGDARVVETLLIADAATPGAEDVLRAMIVDRPAGRRAADMGIIVHAPPSMTFLGREPPPTLVACGDTFSKYAVIGVCTDCSHIAWQPAGASTSCPHPDYPNQFHTSRLYHRHPLLMLAAMQVENLSQFVMLRKAMGLPLD